MKKQMLHVILTAYLALHMVAPLCAAEELTVIPVITSGNTPPQEAYIAYSEMFPGHYTQGASDYTVDGKSVYVLDSTNNAVLRFLDGTFDKSVSLDEYGIFGMYLAAEDGTLYVFANDACVYAIADEKCAMVLDLREYGFPESLDGFFVEDGYLYTANPLAETHTAYRFPLSDEKSPDTFTGTFFDAHTLMTETKDDGQENVRLLTLTDVGTGETRTISVKTETGILLGTQYLGKNEEYCDPSSCEYCFRYYFRTFSAAGTPTRVKETEIYAKQIGTCNRRLQTIDGKIYFLDAKEDAVQLLRLEDRDITGGVADTSVFLHPCTLPVRYRK